MAICKICGREYSRWTTPISAKGVCKKCFVPESRDEPEAQDEDVQSPPKEWPLPPENPLMSPISPPGQSEEQQEPDFVWLGRYYPPEASKLLEQLDLAGIEFLAIPVTNRGVSRPESVIEISVDPNRSDEVRQIHSDLFGDGLPNYDSSFFRDGHNM